jgi:hypothetical protein
LLLVVGAAGCKKGGEDKRKTEAPTGSQAGGESAGSPVEASGGGGGGAADPHAGLDMGGGGEDPHAGLDMGGEGAADPHAGMDMGAGGGGGAGGDPHAGMAGGGMGGMADGPKLAVQTDKEGKAMVGPLRLAVPKGWSNQPAGGMRKAQWELPGAKGAKNATLIVYFFGGGGAGSVEDNLQRWYGQFQPEGGAKAVTPKTEKKKTPGGLAVTSTEVQGRYVAAMMPGASEKNDEPGWMMMAAIVETPMGPYYFKLTGPKATVGAARKDFRAMVDTAQLSK